MSQSYSNIPTYDLSLSRHPYRTGERKQIEPFWQQYPTWAQPGDLKIYYPIPPTNNYYKYNMETQPLVIGYETHNGRKVPKALQGNDTNYPRAKGKVDVYINGVFIEQAPFALLVRFSTAARQAFPKPGKKVEDGGEKGSTLGNWADDEGGKVDMKKLTSDMANLKQPSGPENAVHVMAEDINTNESKSMHKKLDVCMEQIWTQPPIEAFKFAFNWMHEAKRTSNGEQVLEYGVPNPDSLSLAKLVDLYAASLCLGLRPPARKLLSDLFARLTTYPPSIEDVQYIHEHLPTDNRLVTRMITSFLQNRGATAGWYTKAERDEIEAYFYNVDDALYYRFKEIEEYRDNQRKTHQREIGAARLQKLAEGLEEDVSGEKAAVGDGSSKATSKVVLSTPREDNLGGRRRERRKQPGNGKAVNGKASI